MWRLVHFALLCPLALVVAVVEYLDHREPLAWAFVEAWDHTRGQGAAADAPAESREGR